MVSSLHMEMAILPVRQSASKESFLQALGLNLSHSADRQTFSTMWEEVTQYWVQNFETDSRHILKVEYQENLRVRQPYKWGHLSKEAIDRAIDEIWADAGERSRQYYDIGSSADQAIHNWVLKWLLWHVSRYRDERNNKKNRTPMTPMGSSTESSTYSSPVHEAMQLAFRDRDPHELPSIGQDPREFEFDVPSHRASIGSDLREVSSISSGLHSHDPLEGGSREPPSRNSESSHGEPRDRDYWETVMGGLP